MIKKILKSLLLLFLLMVGVVLLANYSIERNARDKTFYDYQDLEKKKVGLLLGTSKYLIDGRVNLYFQYRIKAAVELFERGKIDYILVSGDNGTTQYDEPTVFRKELVKNGIPNDRIILDYAGFRTLDSVVRAKKVFGQNDIVIISQKFHNERAIYLAERNGMKAIGYNAKDVSSSYGFKVTVREYLARTKMFLDIIFNVQPKFLGEAVEIP